jgi:hypothetical protein
MISTITIMNSKFVLIIFLVFTVNQIKAQNNFNDGYLLVSEKDTLFGQINNKNYYSNSQFCEFRYTISDSARRFYPEKIFGYRFKNGKYYVSRDIKIQDDTVRVFVEFLIHGKLDLYFFQDNGNNNHYYISKNMQPLNELIHIKEYIEKDSMQMLHETRPYFGLLTYFTADCAAMKNDIKGLNELGHKKLISFVEKYHNLTCPDQNCVDYEKKLSRKVKINVYGGSIFYLPYYLFGYESGQNNIDPDYGFNVLFQYTQRSEKIYLGIGLYRVKRFEGLIANGYQIPFSINYLNPRKGISPVVSYEFDLNTIAVAQAIRAGLKYQMKNTALFLTGSLNTALLVKAYATSINLGLTFDLN